MGVGKIGWELERISTNEEVGIGMEISCREICYYELVSDDKKGCNIGI